MANTLLEKKSIHFEVHGAGEPVLFLNGALMTTESWATHVEAFSKRYQLILMDFFGQGQSEMVTSEYNCELQTAAVRAVIDELGLPRTHIVGVSYGALIALAFVLKYQNRVKSLVLQGIKSYFDDPYSRALCQGWIEVAKQCDPDKLWDAIVPRAYGPDFYNSCTDVLNSRKALFRSVLSARPREWYLGWEQLVRTFFTFDVRDRLREIHVPALVIGGELDTLVPLKFHEEVHQGIPGSAYIVVPGTAHCPYIAKPNEFRCIVFGFLEAQRQL